MPSPKKKQNQNLSWKIGYWNDWELLDPCLECDERMCGSPFIEFARTNQRRVRRVGVVSNIQRNIKLEVCAKVDWENILESAQAPIQEEMDMQQGSNEL